MEHRSSGSAIVAYKTRRQEKFNKTSSFDVKTGSERPHSACKILAITNISKAVYQIFLHKKVTANSGK